MTDQTESASEYAVLLRNIDFAAAEFDGHPAIYEDAAAALRALEAKVQDLEYQLESTLRSCAGLKGLECVLRADRDRLAGEVENLRMQVVACGMAAQSNTRETHDAFTCHEDYRSASLNDVRAAVAREILHREEVARLTAELAAARENEARYLALVGSGAYVPSQMNKQCPWGLGAGYGRPATKAELDAAIDAARRAGGE